MIRNVCLPRAVLIGRYTTFEGSAEIKETPPKSSKIGAKRNLLASFGSLLASPWEAMGRLGGFLGVSWCLLGCVWGSSWKSLGNLRKSTEIHMKAIGKSQERRQKVMKNHGQSLETIRKSEGNHWNITGKSLYSGVSQGIRLRILAYLRVSSRGLDILTCPGVSWSVLAYPGGVLRNLGETCGVLRSPAASKKPRFPFLCTHR